MNLHRIHPGAALAALAALFAAALHPVAQAASATATVPVAMVVNSPLCTVANSNASIELPPATSALMTMPQYFTANGITTTSLYGYPMFTAASLNQTATISCSLANVMIQSFGIKPSASATLPANHPGIQYLVDSAAAKAGAGDFLVGAEQVSVNTVAAPLNYGYTSLTPNTTPFATGAVTSGASTAQVVWRPYLGSANSAAPIGSPVGGQFTGSFDIVVNY